MIFVDAGAFIARFMRDDQHHRDSLAAWTNIQTRPQRLITTDAVFIETLNFISQRWPGGSTADVASGILNVPGIQMMKVSDADIRAAIGIIAKFGDQEFSFTDCLSFAVMRRLKLRKAFTFDHHFGVAGFEMWAG